ncbi:MAG: hypothetical protein AB7F39_06810 [Variibacter sp.]
MTANTTESGRMLVRSHRFKRMTADMRPQDNNLDGSGLKFETLEHGGAFPDQFPNAIKVTDAEGRWCLYHPVTVNGEVVQSHGYDFNPETGGRFQTPLTGSPV